MRRKLKHRYIDKYWQIDQWQAKRLFNKVLNKCDTRVRTIIRLVPGRGLRIHEFYQECILDNWWEQWWEHLGTMLLSVAICSLDLGLPLPVPKWGPTSFLVPSHPNPSCACWHRPCALPTAAALEGRKKTSHKAWHSSDQSRHARIVSSTSEANGSNGPKHSRTGH